MLNTYNNSTRRAFTRIQLLMAVAALFVITAIVLGIFSGLQRSSSPESVSKNFVEYLFVNNQPDKAYELTNDNFKNNTTIDTLKVESNRLSKLFTNSKIEQISTEIDDKAKNSISRTVFSAKDVNNSEYTIVVSAIKSNGNDKWLVQYYESANTSKTIEQ